MSKTVLVTGASSGIGAAVAQALAERGWQVYGAARRTHDIPATSGIRPVHLDLADPKSIAACADTVLEQAGRVDVLINNAGYGDFAPVELTSPDDAGRQLQVNVVGQMDLTSRLLPGMRAAGHGRIVNVSSVAGTFSSPMGGWYHASKFALEALSDALRTEVRPFGIQVVVVQPAQVRTSWHEEALGGLRERTTGSPYQRMAEAVAHYHEKAASSSMVSSVEDVRDVIVAASLTNEPKVRYTVGRGARVAIALARMTPDRTWDAMMRKQFGLS